jgi:DNA-binding CsgD family transcriptional regulator
MLNVGLSAQVLTPREVEVLELATAGLSTQQTARRLGCAERTVETHRRNIYAKLHATGIAHAVAIFVGAAN